MIADTTTSENSPRRPPSIPFLTTSPFTGIRWAFLCIPVWYVLGLDQFIWPFIAFFLGWQLLWQRAREGRGIILTKVARLGWVYLLILIASGVFIIEREFYIVYVRNIVAWSGGVTFLVVLTNVMTTRNHVVKLLWSWVYVLLFAGVVGLIAFVLRQGFEIKSLALYVVPLNMRDGITAETVWTRSFLAEAGLFAGQIWHRTRSFFLYPNTFAGTLIIAIPLFIYLANTCRRFSSRWWILIFTLIVSSLNLLTTTSRAGILSLLAGLGFALLIRSGDTNRLLFIATLALTIAALLAFVLYDPDGSVTSLTQALEEFTTAKGRSHLTRMNVLEYSLQSWRERPIFGWGTQRNMSLYGFSPRYPRLGSHSQFLNILYITGVVGLLLYFWFVVNLFRRFNDIPRTDWRGHLYVFLIWAALANLLHSAFTQLDIDLTFFFWIWALWGIIDALPLMPISSDRSSFLGAHR